MQLLQDAIDRQHVVEICASSHYFRGVSARRLEVLTEAERLNAATRKYADSTSDIDGSVREEVIRTRFDTRGEGRDLSLRGAAPRHMRPAEDFALGFLAEVHEEVPKLAEAFVTWIRHVHTHGVDSRRTLRVRRGHPDADAENMTHKLLTL